MRFMNRSHAGRKLAGLLGHLREEPAVILGLPRGGVPVGFEVARELSAPLEVLLVRKLGVPVQPELAMGAIGEGGIRIIDEDRVKRLRIRPDQIERVEQRERRELARQAGLFRAGRPTGGSGGEDRRDRRRRDRHRIDRPGCLPHRPPAGRGSHRHGYPRGAPRRPGHLRACRRRVRGRLHAEALLRYRDVLRRLPGHSGQPGDRSPRTRPPMGWSLRPATGRLKRSRG